MIRIEDRDGKAVVQIRDERLPKLEDAAELTGAQVEKSQVQPKVGYTEVEISDARKEFWLQLFS